MMDRRTFIPSVAFGLCATPLAANAQPAGKIYRIGVLGSGPMRTDAEFRQSAWVLGLRDLGWIERQNIVLERRSSNGKADLLPGLARDLVRANVGVIATFSSADTVAAEISRERSFGSKSCRTRDLGTSPAEIGPTGPQEGVRQIASGRLPHRGILFAAVRTRLGRGILRTLQPFRV